MNELYNYTQASYKIKILALFPIIMTILAPYSVYEGGIMICDTLVILFGIYLMISRKILLYKPLLFLLIVDFFLALISPLFTNSRETSIVLAFKIATVFSLYMVTYSSIWSYDFKDTFFEMAKVIGIGCAILAILQFVFSSMGYNFYDGKLFFSLGEGKIFGGLYDRNTHDLRVHSLFAEPSYLGFFELPVTVYLIQKKNYLQAVICAIACIISGSMVGVVGLGFCLVVLLFCDKAIESKTKLRIATILVIGIAIIIYMYNSNTIFKILIDYYIERGMSVQTSSQRSDSSFSQRIMGNIYLFREYGIVNRIIGVGFNQYPLYFGLFKDYSNDFVSNLLNFGYVGFIAMIVSLIFIVKNTSAHGKIFFLIFIIVLAVDHAWFGPMFFYLITWIIASADDDYIEKKFLKVRY